MTKFFEMRGEMVFVCIVLVHTFYFQATETQEIETDDDYGLLIASVNHEDGQSTQSKLKINNWLPPGQELVFSRNDNNAGNSISDAEVKSNSLPVATALPPGFFQCMQRCSTTSEYNPVCATDRHTYGNEQKFDCAKHCGADIQIVRKTSCEGLFQMQRG